MADVQTSPAARDWRHMLGHIVAGTLACALTVSIVGSAAYLGIDSYRKREERKRVGEFVAALEHRNRDEISHIIDELKKRPGLAGRVVPTILRAAQREGTPTRQLAAVEVAAAFIDDARVEKALVGLRLTRNEVVAARAIEALSRVQPPSQAVTRLTECLDTPSPAAVDAICFGLVNLGSAGAAALKDNINKLDPERRVWLCGLIAELRPANAIDLLRPLAADPDARVRARAVEAAASLKSAASVDFVAPVLNDSDPAVRRAAAHSIGLISGESIGANDAGVDQARAWLAGRTGRASTN